MKKKFIEIIRLKIAGIVRHFQWLEKEAMFGELDDRLLGKLLPFFKDRNEAARAKSKARHIKSADCVTKVTVPQDLDNVRKKLRKRKTSLAEYQEAVAAFLGICELFETPAIGYDIAASILCGLRLSHLQKQEASLRMVTMVGNTSQEVQDIFAAITTAIVRRKRWNGKRWTLRRESVLDYRRQPWDIEARIQDFTALKVKTHGHTLRTLWVYADTVAVVIGANNSQLKKAMAHMTQAAVFALSTSSEAVGDRLKISDSEGVDTTVLDNLHQNRKLVAHLLHCWRYTVNPNWAAVVPKAKAWFGKTDSRYKSVVLSPNQVRKMVKYQGFLAFLEDMETEGLLAAETANAYRQGAKAVFDPAPVVVTPKRPGNDPNVVLELLRQLAQETPETIAPLGTKITPSGSFTGAWREISNEAFLVIAEATFERLLKQRLRKNAAFDSQFLQQQDWLRDLQKILANEGYIKKPSSGYRYRYDLFDSGKRDSTYVLAFHRHLIVDA